MKVFVFDQRYCNGCSNCQVGCKDETVDNEWMPYSKPQPNTGQFWLKLKQRDHGQVPKVAVEYTPWGCMHCDECKLIEVDPEAVYKRKDGLVIIDPVASEGKKELVEACPYHAVYWNEELNIPQKCTGCAHLVDRGEVPHCVDLCTMGAWRFGEEEDFAEEIAQAEVMLPESGCRPRVYYLNRPHFFIGGEVWDPKANEIIENAKVSLTKPDGTTEETTTDDFGDFWFRRLDEGIYSINIEAEGFESVKREGIELKESLNIGDFPLVAQGQ